MQFYHRNRVSTGTELRTIATDMEKPAPQSFWLNGPVSQYELVRDFYLEKLKVADPRLDDWPLMSSPLPTLALVAVYLLLVLIGPQIMRYRQPLSVKTLMMIYNFCMVVFSYYLFHELLFGMLDANFNFLCDPVDYSNNPKALRLTSACWFGYFSKFFEFMDTVFFVLRKKNNQITFLHVYHHSSMAVMWWMWVKWAAGGSTCVPPCVNAFIHIIMYSYYFLSGMGPAVQKYLWWKRYITILQLAQFVVLVGHSLNLYLSSCDYPTGLTIFHITYLLTLIILFSNFYIKSYSQKSKQSSSFKNDTDKKHQ